MKIRLLTENVSAGVGWLAEWGFSAWIQYKDSKVESIKITKTFCDYCSENQLNALKQEAWNRAYYERYNPKNRLVNGKRKLALYIRISKKDFLSLKEVEDNTTN